MSINERQKQQRAGGEFDFCLFSNLKRETQTKSTQQALWSLTVKSPHGTLG